MTVTLDTPGTESAELPEPSASGSPPASLPPITRDEWMKLTQEQKEPYIRTDFDPALEYLVQIELLNEAVAGVGEVMEPSRYPIEDDDTGEMRRKTDDELHAAPLWISVNESPIDCRGDMFAQTAAALRRIASEMEAAAVRCESAAIECAELLSIDETNSDQASEPTA